MNVTSEIKEYAKRLGVNLTGVAGVARFASAPEGKRPEDILPGARSVFVVGIRLLDGAVQSKFRVMEDNNQKIRGLYGTYASTIAPNLHMGFAIDQIVRFIEEKTGEVAVPTTSGPFQTDSAFSQRRAAIAAGLAQMGWNGYALNPQYGPRVRYCSIITTAQLDEDPMYSGEKLCDPVKCGMCIKHCPVHAIPLETDKCIETTVGGETEICADRDTIKCRAACYGVVEATSANNGIFGDINPSIVRDIDHASAEDVETAIHHLEPSLTALQIYQNYRCDYCLAYCPVGNWNERFVETGLTKEVL